MTTRLKRMTGYVRHLFLQPFSRHFLQLFVLCSCLGISFTAWADGSDLLSGDLQDATATLGGTGKYVLYLIEGLSSVYVYHKTKNVFVLTSVILIAIFVNVLLKKVTG